MLDVNGTPAGGIVTTAEDISCFDMMMRNEGTVGGCRVLSSAAVRLMNIPNTGDMKAGWVPGGGYRTYEWVDPEKDLAAFS